MGRPRARLFYRTAHRRTSTASRWVALPRAADVPRGRAAETIAIAVSHEDELHRQLTVGLNDVIPILLSAL